MTVNAPNLIPAANLIVQAFGQPETLKDKSDALELSVNKSIAANPVRFDPTAGPLKARKIIADLEQVIAKLSAQHGRDEESEKYQQFSTPPHIAYLAAWIANLEKTDVVLEPSAGTGNLAVFALNAGCTVFANEISERRAKLLSGLPVHRIFRENAEQLHNILDPAISPTVVLMNPPFSVAGTRMKGRVRGAGYLHIQQALLRLRAGGRLVSIIGDALHGDDGSGRGMLDVDSWRELKSEYAVRASIGFARREYAKSGTSFPVRLILIDKADDRAETVVAQVDCVSDAVSLLAGMRERSRIAPVVSRGLFEPEKITVKPVKRIVKRSKRIAAASNEPQRDITAGAVPLEIAVAPVVAERSPLKDVVFEPYRSMRLIVPGAKPHPTPLVESAAMASVSPPEPIYRPMLPRRIVDEGLLSDAQLETVVYTGQAHQQFLEPQLAKHPITGLQREVRYRKGIMVGDGTGLGKGREVAGCIIDTFARGIKKAIWISQSAKLVTDARRDWIDLGGTKDDIIDLSKLTANETVPDSDGISILFLTYGLLKSAAKGEEIDPNTGKRRRGKTRMQQVLDWAGTDFDGVLVLDESHILKNLLQLKKERGKTESSMAAMAGCDLQAALPLARVIYSSATGATEVANLAYCDRLGLFGPGTPFPTKESFVQQIEAGGVAAMELIARDMKLRGMLISRQLSFGAGVEDPKMQVEYDRLIHTLTDEQRIVYDKLAEAWQIVLRRFDVALEVVCGDKPDGKTKGAAYSAFWGAHQRFFNCVITSMQMPGVIVEMEKQLAAGHACVLQLVNTGEAALERQLAKVSEPDDLMNLDMTPRDQLMQLIEHCFPTVQMEEFSDENNNRRFRPVKDSEGNAVQNREAVEMRERLLMELATIRCPDGPVEMILNHFGPDNVAEVTGRKQRVVRRVIDGIERTVVEPRSTIKCTAETAEFQADKRRILIFSDAGGTGASYHAAASVKNQRRRYHFLVQAGWIADKALQGLGRTHRSSQACAPKYVLVSTDLHGQKRFISAIARRLDQLGALTRGQRQAASNNLFSERDNLEGQFARESLYELFRDIYNGRADGISLEQFEKSTGLKLSCNDD